MSIRTWSIRAKIAVLVVPPVATLVMFWLIGTTLSATSSLNLLNAEAAEGTIVTPGRALIAEVQQERRLSAVVLAGRRDRAGDLRQQRARTDAAAAEFRRLAGSDRARDAVGELTVQRVGEALRALDTVTGLRAAVDAGGPDRTSAMTGYGAVTDSVFQSFWLLSELDDPAATRLRRTVFAIGYAREMLSRQDALVAAVTATGRLTAADHNAIAQAIGAQRGYLALVPVELPASNREAYRRMGQGPELSRLRAAEARLLAARAGDPPPFGIEEWAVAYDGATRALQGFEGSVGTTLAAREKTVASTYFWRLGVTGVLGLLAVIFSVTVAARVGRSLVRRLSRLRAAALETAYHRLPDVVERLRRGEDVDTPVAGIVEPGNDEIGQVAAAFNDVHRTAVESAVKEATLRQGLNEVFLNIARRSQTLLHRQLTMLDRMERRATEPEELEDLFRVDHLATRMRRHAEDLVILAGATPGRGWRHPVPLVDVIRGAVSEVEDYARVKILAVPDAALAGRAVADVIHLLAELLENATSYSPPHTRVQVTGELVPNGFAVEIEDRGLGMADEEIAIANARLREPPDFDPANSARLGLFVVALLAARLGVKVTLRSSPYGGVTAVVLIPPDLVEEVPALAGPAVRSPVPAGARGQRAIGAPPAVDLALTGRARPGPAAPSPHTADAPGAVVPPVAAPADPPAGPPPTPSATVLTPEGLPRRVRRPVVDGSTVEPEGHDTQPLPARPPEQTRAMMSSFQAGLARGRQAVGVPEPAEPAEPAERSGPGKPAGEEA